MGQVRKKKCHSVRKAQLNEVGIYSIMLLYP